jgi:DNA topoisomerase-1
LTAKNFRTWKASSILQQELDKNIPGQLDPTHEKKLVYDKANINVALALNHKKLGGGNDGRAEKIEAKIEEYKEKLKKATTDKQKASANKSIALQQAKLEEVENNVATSTSKLNYIDPRIVISWCKKAEMPIEKIYNKQSLKKFTWAMDTVSTWKFT